MNIGQPPLLHLDTCLALSIEDGPFSKLTSSKVEKETKKEKELNIEKHQQPKLARLTALQPLATCRVSKS